MADCHPGRESSTEGSPIKGCPFPFTSARAASDAAHTTLAYFLSYRTVAELFSSLASSTALSAASWNGVEDFDLATLLDAERAQVNLHHHLVALVCDSHISEFGIIRAVCLILELLLRAGG